MRQLIAAITIASIFAACNNATHQSEDNKPKEDILKAHVDTSIHPGDDFFVFANGRWIKENPIPSDETSWGIADLVDNELYTRKLAICEAAAKKSQTPIEAMIGNF